MFNLKKVCLNVPKTLMATTQALMRVKYSKHPFMLKSQACFSTKASGFSDQFHDQAVISRTVLDFERKIPEPTKTEHNLVQYLSKEIIVERQAQKATSFPLTLDGFAVKMNGADIELSKQVGDQNVFIKLNVAHSIDTFGEPENEQNDGRPLEMAEIRSKPRFIVDLVKGPTTLSFTCSFLKEAINDGDYDIFGIDEISIFEGFHYDSVYAVAGDVLDEQFYELLMNYLDEKGVTNEFTKKLSDLATAYEHSSYINLLEKLAKFATD